MTKYKIKIGSFSFQADEKLSIMEDVYSQRYELDKLSALYTVTEEHEYQTLFREGNTIYEFWTNKDGQLHNEASTAIEAFNVDDRSHIKRWFLNGRELTEEEWEKKLGK